MDINEIEKKIKNNETLFLAGDEQLLRKLPKGSWIGGTIPYFMDIDGGIISQDKIFVKEANNEVIDTTIKLYDEKNLSQIPSDAPLNGFSIIIIPAFSEAHNSFACDAPKYKDMFVKPLIGWVAGIHLDDLGEITPKVFNGETGEISDEKCIVMHCSLPQNKVATVGIVNIFEQGKQDEIIFDEENFIVQDCYINGQKKNFAEYLLENNTNIKYPLVADYFGTMINVSFQSIDEKDKKVHFYAPVFKGVKYKLAEPINNYVDEFNNAIEKVGINPDFSCNCILNFLHSELEGKKTANIYGPMTFGEIAYQLLNQTVVYLEIIDN